VAELAHRSPITAHAKSTVVDRQLSPGGDHLTACVAVLIDTNLEVGWNNNFTSRSSDLGAVTRMVDVVQQLKALGQQHCLKCSTWSPVNKGRGLDRIG
jgi:hypothetical protein